MKYIVKVLGYLKPHWKLATLSGLLMVFGGVASLLLPWPLKFLVDNVLQNEPLPAPLA